MLFAETTTRLVACRKLTRRPLVKFERIVKKSGCTRDRTRTTIFLVISSLRTTPVRPPRVALNGPEVTSAPSNSPILPVLSPSNPPVYKHCRPTNLQVSLPLLCREYAESNSLSLYLSLGIFIVRIYIIRVTRSIV